MLTTTRLMTNAEVDARARYCYAPCTLNGRPAKVQGARNPFATVSSLDGEQSFEYSWLTVKRIIEQGGERFKSI